MESQMILVSEGWETSKVPRNGDTFITRLTDANDSESHAIPSGKLAGQNDKYSMVDVNASDYPILFGEGAKGAVRMGIPKLPSSGGLAAVGCGPCLEGVIIPKFEWHCSVLIHADGR